MCDLKTMFVEENVNDTINFSNFLYFNCFPLGSSSYFLIVLPSTLHIPTTTDTLVYTSCHQAYISYPYYKTPRCLHNNNNNNN